MVLQQIVYPYNRYFKKVITHYDRYYRGLFIIWETGITKDITHITGGPIAGGYLPSTKQVLQKVITHMTESYLLSMSQILVNVITCELCGSCR